MRSMREGGTIDPSVINQTLTKEKRPEGVSDTEIENTHFKDEGKEQWHNRGDCPPKTCDWEISADLLGKERQGKKGKWVKKEGKSVKGRWKIENGRRKCYKISRRPFFFFFFTFHISK